MSNDVHIVTYALGDPGADNKKLWLLRAPSDAQGGGIRIIGGEVVNQIAVTNSLGVGGTTFTLALHKYSNAGTPAVNGTIAAAIGGTAVGWEANVPQAFSIDEAYSFVDAGEWLVAQYNEINAGNPTLATVTIRYKVGK